MIPKTTKFQNQEVSLLWPFMIIGVGIIVSMSFVFFILKGYRRPRPLVIKPSSVESFNDVANALFKSLYPLKKQGYNFYVTPIVNEDELNFATELKKYFPPSDSSKNMSITLQEVNLNLSPPGPTQLKTCKENNQFILHRKRDKIWTKKIYFTVCKEKRDQLILSYSLDSSPLTSSM